MPGTALIFPSLCFWQYCLYISSAMFIVLLPISFVHYIHWRAALIFRTLYPWLYEVLAHNTVAVQDNKAQQWGYSAILAANTILNTGKFAKTIHLGEHFGEDGGRSSLHSDLENQ